MTAANNKCAARKFALGFPLLAIVVEHGLGSAHKACVVRRGLAAVEHVEQGQDQNGRNAREPGAARLDFSESSHAWDACSRVNTGTNPDSMGVQLVYRYRLTTPLGSILSFMGGAQASTITFREKTVMALNPT